MSSMGNPSEPRLNQEVYKDTVLSAAEIAAQALNPSTSHN